MATTVVSISFDQEFFKEEKDCEHWLRDNPDFTSLLSLRDFKLKTVASCKRMAPEGRKIFYFQKDVWAAKQIAVLRPNVYVRIETRITSNMWEPKEVPPLSAKALVKKNTNDEKIRNKDENRTARKEKARINRKRKQFSKTHKCDIKEVGWDENEQRAIKLKEGEVYGDLLLPKKITIRRQKRRKAAPVDSSGIPEIDVSSIIPSDTLSFVIPPNLKGTTLSPR